MNFNYSKPVFFIANEGSGGGGQNDPHDYDRLLADQFYQYLEKQRLYKLSTPRAGGLSECAQGISNRFNEVGGLTLLLAKELQPIAERLMQLGPSDRINPIVIEHKFEGFHSPLD